MMKEKLEYFIRSVVKNPCEEEIKDILEIFHLETLPKGEHFKHRSELCTKLGFLVEGSVRVYATKSNGKEITVKITKKDNLVADLVSVRTQEKTPVSIEALEPTQMLVTSIKQMKELLEVNLTLNKLIREHMADRVASLGVWHVLFLAGNAQERYKFILDNNPDFLKNIPLRFIASMIGITPTQLSRIRKKK